MRCARHYVAVAGFSASQRGHGDYIPGAVTWIMAQSIHFTPCALLTTLVKQLSKSFTATGTRGA